MENIEQNPRQTDEEIDRAIEDLARDAHRFRYIAQTLDEARDIIIGHLEDEGLNNGVDLPDMFNLLYDRVIEHAHRWDDAADLAQYQRLVTVFWTAGAVLALSPGFSTPETIATMFKPCPDCHGEPEVLGVGSVAKFVNDLQAALEAMQDVIEAEEQDGEKESGE